MCDDNFSKRLKKHIEEIGIDNIKETLSKAPPGPTDEEFFWKRTSRSNTRKNRKVL